MRRLLQELVVDGDPVKFYLMNSADDPYSFYGEMGYIFASAEIRKELDGYPINNDPGRQWVVAFRNDDIVGFRSFGQSEGKGVFYEAWVAPQYRRSGIYRAMLALAESELTDKNVKIISVVANEKARPILEKFGFDVDRMRGRFAYMHKDLS
ncbi:MAG: GNAT family N-acetyltransferase [Synergistota bacterium]|nr:GNAT family N-acetyltransferase [Synergistota bacterium]